MTLSRLAVLVPLAVLTLSACQQTQIDLDYRANPATARQGPAVIGVGRFQDMRPVGEGYVGSVTVLQAPTENLHLSAPIEESIPNVLAQALAARHMLASDTRAKYVLEGEVLDLRCEMLVNPFASATIRFTLREAKGGKVLHSAAHVGRRHHVFYLRDTPNTALAMRNVTARAVQDCIEMALDSNALRKALRSAME
jgi:hypothetical protein